MGCKSLEKTKQKLKHKKGLWSPEEDQKLRNYILQFGHGCWSSVPINAGLQRNGKSCRLRWINYLRPGLKRGIFTTQEEETILNLHRALGNKWSQIAQHLPGRTDNEIKNFWHSYLKKKVAKIEVTEPFSEDKSTTSNSSIKSLDTVSSFQSFEVGEGSSMNSSESVGNQKSCLPKLFFAEWLDFDNTNNSNQYEQNNIQGDQFPYYHSKDVDLISCNFDLQESFSQGVTYNEESYSNVPSYNEVGKDTFDSQLRLEDQVQENGFGDFLIGNEISNDLFMTNNLMYI